ncbi:MAG: C40 family peptidase [Maribacter sp.]|nr:C40 family peptidase [Maribacter sp.]
MHYGICNLSIVPIRLIAENSAEMVSQLLYGEHYKILEQRKQWSKIRTAFDNCEGWVQNLQITLLTESEYQELDDTASPQYTADLVSFIETEKNYLLPIVMGSIINTSSNHGYEGSLVSAKKEKTNLIKTAVHYLNTPYLWGGKTPFGLDSSGFTQMVYKINGYGLLRKAAEQATQGDPLSFIEECEVGDLAFFDNSEGIIDHVGIIMDNNYIIHAHGKVRIDRIDHTGIFNNDTKTYTHQLRVIKQLI